MKKRLLLLCLLAFAGPWTVAHGQWAGGLSAGLALPAGASDNAPELSTAMTAGLHVQYLLGRTHVYLTAMVDGVHWLSTEDPDHLAVPLDEKMYTNRFLFFPFTVGMGYFGDLCHGMVFDIYAAAGGYWRNIICRQMSAPGVMDGMNESGWGFACKVGADIYINKHFRLGVSYLMLGNPSATGGEPLPAGADIIGYGSFLTGPDNDIPITVRRSQPSLSRYGQGFLLFTLGYCLY